MVEQVGQRSLWKYTAPDDFELDAEAIGRENVVEKSYLSGLVID
jgi:hypothetical protein